MPNLDDEQQRAIRACLDALRPAAFAALRPPTLATSEQVVAWLPGARAGLKEARRTAQQALAVAQAQIAAAGRSGEDEPAWKRLEEASRRLEQELISPATLRARMDEGRRSMMPRVEAVVAEQLRPMTRLDGGRLVAELDPEGLRVLEQELPRWTRAWSEFALGWLDVDIDRLVQVLWRQREGDLPVPPPTFGRLVPAELDRSIQFPGVVVEREQTGMATSMLRNGRAVLYGLMSLTFLVGVSSDGRTRLAVIVLGVPVAVVYGFVQARTDRQKEQERLVADARQKAEAATRDVLRTWLDRGQDKLTEQARLQLMERREALVTWYRTQVAPARERRASDHAQRAAQAEQARRDLPRHQDLLRDVEKAVATVEALGRAVGEGR